MSNVSRSPVVIVPYDPAWPAMFEAARAEIERAAGEHIEAIEHFGSTAVPGLAAKPIIDVLAAVADWDRAKVIVDPLVALGWLYRGEYGIQRRRYFVKPNGPDDARTHHLHVVERASNEWREQLAFRDYLRAHAPVAADYAALKRVLAARFGADREGYTEAKASFVRRIVALAAAESDGEAAAAR